MLYRLVLHPWTLGHDLLSGTPRAHPSTCRLGFRGVCLRYLYSPLLSPLKCAIAARQPRRRRIASRCRISSWHDAKGCT